MNTQLMLIAGKTLETGTGHKIVLGDEKIEWGDAELDGWTLTIPAGMHLSWPVLPFNPYKNKPETELATAIGRLFILLKNEDQEFQFTLKVE